MMEGIRKLDVDRLFQYLLCLFSEQLQFADFKFIRRISRLY